MFKLQLLSEALSISLGSYSGVGLMPLYTTKELAASAPIIQTLTVTKQNILKAGEVWASPPYLELNNHNLLSSATFQPCRISGFAISESIPHRGSQTRTACATPMAEKQSWSTGPQGTDRPSRVGGCYSPWCFPGSVCFPWVAWAKIFPATPLCNLQTHWIFLTQSAEIPWEIKKGENWQGEPDFPAGFW